MKYSRDKNNSKQYCIVPVTPSPTLAECGRWECFESNPDGHDFQNEDEIKDIPEIKVDAYCDDWCNIKIGDRRKAIINSKYKKWDFDAVIHKIGVSCDESGKIEVDFNISASNHKDLKRNALYQIRDLKKRIRMLELN
jgi:hypothetical protein